MKGQKDFVRWLVVLGVPSLVYYSCHIFGVKESYGLFFTITAWAASAWALEVLPEAIVGLVVPVLFILGKVAGPSQVLSPWLTGVPWAILGGMAVGAVMMNTGLASRLAYRLVLCLGLSFPRILVGLMLTGMVIAPFVPSALGKMAIMSVIGMGVCEVLGFKPKSKAAAAVMLTCFFSVSCPALSYMTGGLHVAIVGGFLGKVSATGLSWSEYAYHNWIIGGLFSVAALLLVQILLKPERPIENIGYIKARYDEIGPVSVPEKRATAILAAILVGFVTDRMHGIDAAWIMVLATFAFFLPGIRLLDGEKFSRLGFPLLIFITGAMSIGATANAIGISRVLGEILVSWQPGSSFISLIYAYVFGALSAFFIQSVALVGALTPPLIEAAGRMGLSPNAVAYSFLFGTEQVIFPYQFAVLAYVCSSGYISYRQVITVMALRIIVDFLLFVGIAVPYWKWIGLM